MKAVLKCVGCESEWGLNEVIHRCEKCDELLEVQLDLEAIKEEIDVKKWEGIPASVWKYGQLIPILDRSKIVTLNEGGTGLYRCESLAKEIGVRTLYLKNDGENPTGSFKDRGMTVGITKARELQARAVACASTGNTSASLAAYAARARMKCIVLVPHGAIAASKLAQAIVYGAKVVAVKGNFDDALAVVIKASERLGLYLLNSINPFRIEGQKTAAFEVCDQLGWRVPDRLVIPVGNAGNISAYWKGFKEFYDLGVIDALPMMAGIQASGASPIADAFKAGRDHIQPVKDPQTVASAIRIGHPVSWKRALRAIRESRGRAEVVRDEEILSAQRLIAMREGIFVETASAASVAGLKKLVELGTIDRDEEVVCVATGHGLKDPDSAFKVSPQPVVIEPSIEGLKKAIEDELATELVSL